MKKVLIYIIVIALGILIVVIILGDFMSGRKTKSTVNPYAYKIDEYVKVDPSLIQFREIRRVGLNIPGPKSIDVFNDRIGIGYENRLQVIDTTGLEILNKIGRASCRERV